MIKFNYIGSKYRILDFIIPEIWPAKTLVDPFCGTCSVSYEAKKLGIHVVSGDNLLYPYMTAKAIVENNNHFLDDGDIQFLLSQKSTGRAFDIYGGIYLTREVWDVIEAIRNGIEHITEEKKALALMALCATTIYAHSSFGTFACKTNFYDGRHLVYTREQAIGAFIKKCKQINSVVCEGSGVAVYGDAIETIKNNRADVLYLDPPYVTMLSNTNYYKSYHLLENIIQNFKLELNNNSRLKIPIKKQKVVGRSNIHKFLCDIISSAINYKKILLSYNENGIPCIDEMVSIFRNLGWNVTIKKKDILYHRTKNSKSKTGTELLYIATRA